jgi:HAD superfamily hydrolase (TIGR01509 family)
MPAPTRGTLVADVRPDEVSGAARGRAVGPGCPVPDPVKGCYADRDGALAAVLWDMDGTLVDTEPYWMEAEQVLVAEHGGTWSQEDAHALVGSPLMVSAEFLRRRGGVDLEPVVIVERLLAHVVARVGERIPWRPGALELLDELGARGVPCALVTMSWTSLADAVLGRLPDGTFAAVVTGDAVQHGKPHPEPYLRAVERLGVQPSACVAIEDSVTGLRSAESAGAATIGVPHLVPIPPAPRRVVVGSLTEVDVDRLVRVARSAQAGVSEP